MESRLTWLKDKLTEYQQLLKNGPQKIENNKVSEVLDEINNMKEEIKKLTEESINKSKIEQMKILMNISSLESEIQVKELSLDEIKDEIETAKKEVKENFEQEKNNKKEEIIEYLINTENMLEKAVKNNVETISLNKDLEDIKTYYINVSTLENNNLKKFNLELDKIEKEGKEIEETYESLISQAQIYARSATEWFSKDATNIWGDFDEDKWDDYQWEGRQCQEEMNRLYKEAEPYKKKVNTFRNQKEQLNIKINGTQNKLNKLNDLLNEMLYEIIQEEIKKRGIIFPTEIISDELKYFIREK